MKRILIVDDEPHVIRVMRLALENAGYSVEEAGNGQQALEKIRSNPPDLLISDIDMPRMTGRELCSRITEEMPDRKFGIYILTARAEDEHRSWSRAMGNLDFLEKPVSIRRLLGRLEDFFVNNRFSGERQCHPSR
ncbi:MAG TPA: response regulator [Gammaproteobacteria bacterium]|nr:response regulator [Gammaproteobacteria bacterium]